MVSINDLDFIMNERVYHHAKADAAVVLGAAVTEGKPFPVLKGRNGHALELYWGGNAKKLFITGGIGEKEISEAEASRRYALEEGVNRRIF